MKRTVQACAVLVLVLLTGSVATANEQCIDNIEVWIKPERPDASPVSAEAMRETMGFRIFESSVSGTSFTMGALVRNRSGYDYYIRKADAELFFTRYDEGRTWESVPYRQQNHVAVVPITITSWEDGESPALRLAPCEEKWVRFEAKLEGAEALKFAAGAVEQASIQLSRLVIYGWGANSSLTFTLDAPRFVEPLKKSIQAK